MLKSPESVCRNLWIRRLGPAKDGQTRLSPDFTPLTAHHNHRSGVFLFTEQETSPGNDREVDRMQSRLKLYTGEENRDTQTTENKVTISLGELVSVLTDATQSRRAWLRDFRSDEVQISADLYDVLSTYWNMRRGA